MDRENHIALLVLAHKAPGALAETARVFGADPRFRILVHLDSKIALADFSNGRTWPENVEFLDQRLDVFWGGFNLVRATEALARRALADPKISACCLISDDTLPLCSPSRIFEALLAQPHRIDVGLSKRNPPFLRRFTEFFYMDSPATSARPREIQSRQFDATALGAIQRLTRLKERGKFPFPEIWGGSQWWSLGREMLEAILGDLSGDLWIRESFEFSAVPDELAFQTLYANRMGLTARSFTSPMLTDVTRAPSPFVFRSLEELPAAPPGKLFIRKVENDSAATLMRGIEARWNHV